MAPVLLSRALDPFLGVFTGAFAYYLYESNPRTAIPPQDRLSVLLEWKLAQWRSDREKRLAGVSDDEAVLSALKSAVEKE